MDELNKLYYNSLTGYSSLQNLIQQAHQHKLQLTNKQIKEWYQSQTVNQIYKPIMPVKHFAPIVSHTLKPGELYADLMDVSRFSRSNKGVKYLLNCVDLYSRYAWSFPLKNKKPDTIEPYIESIINEIPKGNIITFAFDNGNEFKGSVKALLDENNIKIYLNDPTALNAHHVMALVERFNRTVWGFIKKYLTSQNTLTYIDQLPHFITNYNNSIHSSTLRKPIEAFQDKIPHIYMSPDYLHWLDQRAPKYQIGDLVRVQKVRKTFDKKGLKPTFSNKIYKIINNKDGVYKLNNEKKYYEEQLVLANEEQVDNRLMKDNEHENRKERILKEEFKKPIEQIEKQVVQGKRERKPRAFYGITK